MKRSKNPRQTAGTAGRGEQETNISITKIEIATSIANIAKARLEYFKGD